MSTATGSCSGVALGRRRRPPRGAAARPRRRRGAAGGRPAARRRRGSSGRGRSSSANRTRRRPGRRPVTASPAPMSAATAHTATVSSAAPSSRAPATTETATIATPIQSRGSRQPGWSLAPGGAAGASGAPEIPAHAAHHAVPTARWSPGPPQVRVPAYRGRRAEMRRWRHGRHAPLPDARRRGRGAQHLERAGLRAGPPRRPAGDQDRRPRPVAGRGDQARGVHPADVRRDPDVRRRSTRSSRPTQRESDGDDVAAVPSRSRRRG